MLVTHDMLIEDLATAAATACSGFLEQETIVSDIKLELDLGSAIDEEQLPKFLEVLKNGEGLAKEDGYKVDTLVLALDEVFNNPFDIYWDRVVELVADDNDVEISDD